MMTYVTVDSDTETGSEVEVIEEISTPRNTNKIMFFFYAYLALKKSDQLWICDPLSTPD